MVITKIDLNELSQTIDCLFKELSTKPTTSIDYHDWLFVAGKIRHTIHGRSVTSYHVVANNKVKPKCIEKRVETYKEIKMFLMTVVIIEAEEGS
jgi:hypothetical protein